MATARGEGRTTRSGAGGRRRGSRHGPGAARAPPATVPGTDDSGARRHVWLCPHSDNARDRAPGMPTVWRMISRPGRLILRSQTRRSATPLAWPFLDGDRSRKLDTGTTIESDAERGTGQMRTASGAPDSMLEVAPDADRGVFSGVRRIVHTHSLETDALLAAAVLAVSTLWLVTSAFSGPRIAVLQAALILPLVWRRRSPSLVFCVMAALALVQWSFDYRHARRRRAY